MKYEDTVFSLSKQEYIIIYLLVKNRGRIVSRSEFAVSLWEGDRKQSRAVDMHISSLRKKLHNLRTACSFSIETIHGEGYLII